MSEEKKTPSEVKREKFDWNSEAFTDFTKETQYPLGIHKWIPLFFSDPKATLLNRILISITFFPAGLFLVLFTIYFFLYLGTFIWDFEIELFGFRGSKLLSILFIPYMVFGVTGGCLGFLALKDVFIKIENKRLINKAEELKAMNLEEIVEIYEELDKPGETARVRKLKADLTSPKTEIHGGDDKFSRLKELTEMKEKGLIDDDEFKQMKNEILGK